MTNVVTVKFATPEDRDQMLKIYQDISEAIKKYSQELDAMWEHVHKLEEKLLAKREVPDPQIYVKYAELKLKT